MLEWMKDENINRFFQFDSQEITEDTVKTFIDESKKSKESFHFAIVDKDDTYLGPVSLKNVNLVSKNAEYAISLRSKAQGIGAGKFATMEILKFAFKTLDLRRVYLNVLSENKHAITFYKKAGFICEGEFYHHICLRGTFQSLMWFRMMKEEYEKIGERE